MTTVQQAAQAATEAKDVERTQVATLRTAVEKTPRGSPRRYPTTSNPTASYAPPLTAINVRSEARTMHDAQRHRPASCKPRN